MKNLDAFFVYARERYRIKLARDAGRPWPWTADEVLQRYRFCNIFREDDTTTQWIRRTITEPGYGPNTLGALVIARWFNRVETIERLLPPEDATPAFPQNLLYSWGVDMCAPFWEERMRARLSGVSPLVTAAYMVKTPARMSKLEGLLWCMHQFLPDAQALQREFMEERYRLHQATDRLAQYPYLGPFMAYEVVTDLRHTPILADAPDIMYWANPGPGAARGLARVMGVPLDTFDRHKPEDVKTMIAAMRHILERADNPANWPWRDERPWEMREVEHTLCEYDKYERAWSGEGKPKQLYHRKGAQ